MLVKLRHRSKPSWVCVAIVGAALAFDLGEPSDGLAQGDANIAGQARPANAVVMPFDTLRPRARTSLTLSNPTGTSPYQGSEVLGVSTHWAFWSETGSRLADVLICMALGQTVEVDPRDVSSLGLVHTPIGPAFDLSGTRGFVVITAYQTDPICSDPSSRGFQPVDDALVGSFAISEKGPSRGYGGTGVGLPLGEDGAHTVLPGYTLNRLQTSVRIGEKAKKTFSRIVFIALQERSGAGDYSDIEVGPADGDTTALVGYVPGASLIPLALPSLSFSSARFTSVFDFFPAGYEDRLRPIGALDFADIRVGGQPIGSGNGTYVVGLHGQVVEKTASTAWMTAIVP